MGTLLTLRTSLRNYTGKSSTILTDAICDEFVAAAQERMDQAHRWRGQEKTSSAITYTASDDGKDLPTDFISELVLSLKDAAQTNPSIALTPLQRAQGGRVAWLNSRAAILDRDQSYPQTAYPGAILGDEIYYYFWAAKLFVVPQPSSSKTLILDYYANVAALVDPGATTNFFTANYYSCLKWGALVEAWGFLHESIRAAAADALFEKLLARAIKHDQTIVMSGPPRARGA